MKRRRNVGRCELLPRDQMRLRGILGLSGQSRPQIYDNARTRAILGDEYTGCEPYRSDASTSQSKEEP